MYILYGQHFFFFFVCKLYYDKTIQINTYSITIANYTTKTMESKNTKNYNNTSICYDWRDRDSD